MVVLTHFSPMFDFYTPRKRPFLGSLEIEHWVKMGYSNVFFASTDLKDIWKKSLLCSYGKSVLFLEAAISVAISDDNSKRENNIGTGIFMRTKLTTYRGNKT